MNNMIETAKNEVKEIIMSALGRLIAEGKLPAEPLPGFMVEIPADSSHGDFSCNAALASAKTFRTNPRAIATMIAENAVHYNRRDPRNAERQQDKYNEPFCFKFFICHTRSLPS